MENEEKEINQNEIDEVKDEMKEEEGVKEKVEKEEKEPQKAGLVDEDKAVTVLSYIGILFLVPLLMKKESQFAQFHAKQGLVLVIGWVIGAILYGLFLIGALVHLAIIILSIMGIIDVLNGKQRDLPIVGDIAKKFNI